MNDLYQIDPIQYSKELLQEYILDHWDEHTNGKGALSSVGLGFSVNSIIVDYYIDLVQEWQVGLRTIVNDYKYCITYEAGSNRITMQVEKEPGGPLETILDTNL